MKQVSKQEFKESFGRIIKPNEIVFDFDDRDWGFHGINFTGINLYNAGYKFEIWYSEGGKSPHLHLKDIQFMNLKNWEQIKEYKKLFMRKYAPKKYLMYLDIQLIGKHRIAEENKPHYKYKTIKKLMGVWNENKENIAEEELIKKAQQVEVYHPTYDPHSTIIKQVSITDIARKYGLKFRGKMVFCPFHEDKTPSLSLSDKKGLFNCFGCNASGNIIKFIQMLEDLK